VTGPPLNLQPRRYDDPGVRQPEAIALYMACGYRRIAGFGYYRQSRSARFFGKPLV
jgi:hypothetical protein